MVKIPIDENEPFMTGRAFSDFSDVKKMITEKRYVLEKLPKPYFKFIFSDREPITSEDVKPKSVLKVITDNPSKWVRVIYVNEKSEERDLFLYRQDEE